MATVDPGGTVVTVVGARCSPDAAEEYVLEAMAAERARGSECLLFKGLGLHGATGT